MDPSSFTHGIEKTGGSDMNSRERVVRLGIDIGKNSFHLWGVNRATRPAGVTPALSGGGKGAHGRGQPAARVVRGEWHGGRQERCRRFWKRMKATCRRSCVRCWLNTRIRGKETQLHAVFKQQEACQRLAAIVAVTLGLVLCQHGAGGKVRLLGISKRGNRHLHTLLVHGACSVV